MTHEEIFKEEIHKFSNEEHTEEKKNHLWKFVLAIIVLIFIILYFTSGPFGLSNIIGLLGSDKAEANDNGNVEIKIRNLNLDLTQEVYDQLVAKFNEDPVNEFKVCLFGEKNENTYHIKSMTTPKVYDESLVSVNADLCPKEALISLHSHPFNNCEVSETDKESQRYFKQINNESVGGVMCAIDRFILYG